MAFPVWFKADRHNPQAHRKPEFMRRGSEGLRGALGQIKTLIEDRYENMAENLKTYRVRKGSTAGTSAAADGVDV